MPSFSLKTALVIGISGQDGSSLKKLVVDKSNQVWGIQQCDSPFKTSLIDHLSENPYKMGEQGLSSRSIRFYGALTYSTNLI